MAIGAEGKVPGVLLIICAIMGAILGGTFVAIFMALAFCGGILALVGQKKDRVQGSAMKANSHNLNTFCSDQIASNPKAGELQSSSNFQSLNANRFCSKCGKEIETIGAFCGGCGTPLKSMEAGRKINEQENSEEYGLKKQLSVWNVHKMKTPEVFGGYGAVSQRLLCILSVLAWPIGLILYLLTISSNSPVKKVQGKALLCGSVIGVILSIALFPSGMLFSSNSVQKELSQYYNKEIPKISPLEKAAISAFESVSGENYKDDELMQEFLIGEIIPKYSEFVAKLENISLKTEEVRSIHKDYVEGARLQLDAFKTLSLAIEKGDRSLAREANRKLMRGKEKIGKSEENLQGAMKKISN
jgi:hypothetical protein